MGIPFYFKTLVNRHYGIIQPIDKNYNCSRLFLDFNSILHMCASEGKLHRTIMDDALAYIEVLIKVVKPTDLVYIAVDGTCPKAKMVQQRKRRFISAWRREILGGTWDSNIITPGTPFMKEFDLIGASFCKNLQERLPHLKIIFTGSCDFGEGEHKIFQYIRTSPIESSGDDCIYGLDADLIMLALLSKRAASIKLLRERPVFDVPIKGDSEYLLMDIHALSTRIKAEYGLGSVCDYVVLCILLGNDFLPPLSFLKIKNNAIDYIMKTYSECMNFIQGCTSLIHDDGTLNLTLLSAILSDIAKNEDANFIEAHDSYMRRRPFINRKVNDFRAQELDNYPTLHKQGEEIAPDKPGWRSRYYQHMFGSTSSETVTRASKEYLDGLMWVTRYYTGQSAPLAWSYTYSYSPTVLDLSNYVASLSGTPEIKTSMNDVKYLELMATGPTQLLAVLPPQSKNLLSSELQDIMTDVNKGCVYMYPIKFKMNTYLKNYLWECTPKLPEVDLRRLGNVLINHQKL